MREGAASDTSQRVNSQVSKQQTKQVTNQSIHKIRYKNNKVNIQVVIHPNNPMPKPKNVKHKHKQFFRSNEPPEQRRLIMKDIELFKDVASYRFLDSQQIGLLHPAGKTYRKRRLQWLFHAGYLDRPKSQAPYLDFRPRRHLIYGLDQKGAAVLLEHHPELRPSLKWLVRKKTQEQYLWHTMMVTDFRVCLTLAFKDHKQAKLVSWKQGEAVKDYARVNGKNVAVVPDGFFTLEDKGDHLHYMLEADRSTMDLKRFVLKLKAYRQWKKSGAAEKAAGIKRFRVLTITKSEERMENLRELAKQADEAKQGSEMFLFACEKRYDLANPKTILEPIWKSPKDDKPHHLLE